tara:strand:+ start:55 stop:645 length:591 start_codon:yes stop_codon:yes gene_type:complete
MSEVEILSLLEARHNAKMMRDFDEADQIRTKLQAGGVNVNDAAKTWSTNDGRGGDIPQGGGFSRGDRKLEDGSIEWANTIYVAGLPSSATVTEVADFFGQLGPIKKSKKRGKEGEPTVHLYLDKRTQRPKGDCTVSFEESETAQAAIKWYDGEPFAQQRGTRLSISIAKRPGEGTWSGGGKGKGGGGGKGYGGGRY